MMIPDFELLAPWPRYSRDRAYPISRSCNSSRFWWYQGHLDPPLTDNSWLLSYRLPILCAIGWLGDHVESTGETPESCIDKLARDYENGHVTINGAGMGFHVCELCSEEDHWRFYTNLGIDEDGENRGLNHTELNTKWKGRTIKLYGRGHYLYKHGCIVYVAPALLLHYILVHKYRPPEPFVQAVEMGRLLTDQRQIYEDAWVPEELRTRIADFEIAQSKVDLWVGRRQGVNKNCTRGAASVLRPDSAMNECRVGSPGAKSPRLSFVKRIASIVTRQRSRE